MTCLYWNVGHDGTWTAKYFSQMVVCVKGFESHSNKHIAFFFSYLLLWPLLATLPPLETDLECPEEDEAEKEEES